MELKTQSDTLKRLAGISETLVDQLKDYVINNGIRVGTASMNIGEAQDFTRIIRTNLEGISINGDENVLDDIVAIYDKAIKSIETELEKNKELEDGNVDKFNDATIESFNNVKKVLENSKNGSVGPIKTILDELTTEIENGDIDKEYKEKKIEEIDADTRKINSEIAENTSSLENFESETRDERIAYEETIALVKQYYELKKEIEDIDKELAKPDIPDEEKAELESQKAEKEKNLISVLKDINDRTDKDKDYKQGKEESDKDYLKRIQSKDPDMYVKRAQSNKQYDLSKKLESLKNKEIKVYDEKTKTFKKIKVKDYIDKDDASKLAGLSEKIETDRNINRDAVKSKKEEIEKLNRRKENYTNGQSNPNKQPSSPSLPAVPEEMGFWSKFKKRMEFNREHEGEGRLKSFFKSFSKHRDEEVFEEQIKKSKHSNETRKEWLKDIEVKVKSGETANRVKAAIKTKIFKEIEKEDENLK